MVTALRNFSVAKAAFCFLNDHIVFFLGGGETFIPKKKKKKCQNVRLSVLRVQTLEIVLRRKTCRVCEKQKKDVITGASCVWKKRLQLVLRKRNISVLRRQLDVTLDTFSIFDAKRKTLQKTDNNPVCVCTQNTLQVWTNANAT